MLNKVYSFTIQNLKKILQSFGYSFYKINRDSISLRNTMLESLYHLNRLGFQPSTIIDVGTANGTFPLLKVFPSSNFLWIEPLSEFEPDLIKLKQKYKGDYLIAAAGKYDGSIDINVHEDLVGSSLLHESDGTKADGLKRAVRMVKLDSLYEKDNLSDNILLKIDVQGTELDVLEGAEKLINKCEVILLEVSFLKFLGTNPEFFDVIFYMKQKGFVVYDIVEGINRPLDFALAQKDIVFVKEFGQFRQSHGWSQPV